MPDLGHADPDALLRAGFVEMADADDITLDLRYATANNFTRRAVPGAFDRLILHRIAADKLRRAVHALAERQPGRRILVLDGLRPDRIQQAFWELVRGIARQTYVGDPAVGSIHGFGLAVAASLVYGTGREVDMGTPFDDFGPQAEPRREARLPEAGELDPQQVAHRHLLRDIMLASGFTPLRRPAARRGP